MSYQGYLDGLRDGISIGLNAGLRKGYELGQSSGYLTGYRDGYDDGASGLPYSSRERLLEYKMIMPKIPTLASYEEPVVPKLELPEPYLYNRKKEPWEL